MAINTPVDPMAELETLVNSKDEKSSSFAPFFFSIQDGQKALIRPLLNLNQYVRVDKHEIFNPALKKFDIAAICASSLPLAGCAFCEEANQKGRNKDESLRLKKLAATPRIVLPIYVHAVLNTATGEPITYIDKDGKEQPVCGVRLLEMKKSSTILKDLMDSFNGRDDSGVDCKHDISTIDYVIRRDGVQLDTVYKVTPKVPRSLPADDIPGWTRDRAQVLLQYAETCPFELVGDESLEKLDASAFSPAKPSNGNGKVKNAPDF